MTPALIVAVSFCLCMAVIAWLAVQELRDSERRARSLFLDNLRQQQRLIELAKDKVKLTYELTTLKRTFDLP